MIVADASAVLDLLLARGAAPKLQAMFLRQGETLHSPQLVDLEVAHALRRLVNRGLVRPRRADTVLEYLAGLELTRYPHLPLLDRIWALRANLTAYDAAYVALAEILAAPLVTTDAPLAHSKGHGARIEFVSG